MTLPVFGRLPLSAALGLLIVAATVVLFAFGPMLAPFGQEEVLGTPFADPSAAHLLGLDQNGRDMLSRLLYGAQMSVGVSLAAVLISFCIGIPLGFLAALTGGWPDLIGARFVDVIMSIPVLISALVVLQALGSSLPVLIGTIALLDSTRVFRLVAARDRSIPPVCTSEPPVRITPAIASARIPGIADCSTTFRIFQPEKNPGVVSAKPANTASTAAPAHRRVSSPAGRVRRAVRGGAIRAPVSAKAIRRLLFGQAGRRLPRPACVRR